MKSGSGAGVDAGIFERRGRKGFAEDAEGIPKECRKEYKEC